MITAYKITHFSFLKDLRTGDQINIQAPGGTSYSFIVRGADIVNKDSASIAKLEDQWASAQFALVAPYPFDSIGFGGPMRYVVFGDLANSSAVD